MVGELYNNDNKSLTDVGKAGEAITVGTLVCRDHTDGKLYKYTVAQRDDRSIMGIAIGPKTASTKDKLSNIASGESFKFIREGYVEVNVKPNDKLGSKVYYDSTNNYFTKTAITNAQIIGVSFDEDKGSNAVGVYLSGAFSYN